MASGPEVVLVDVHGTSAAVALSGVHAPLVVLSAEPPAWDGVARWVRKPARPADVAEAVIRACARFDVLIIEDDFDLARVLIMALEESGIRAEHAASGRAAIDSLSQRVPALVVLDVVLPEGDGFF